MHLRYTIFLVVYSVTLAIMPAASLLLGQICDTPNNSSGSCNHLKDCKSLFSLLKTEPLTPSNRDFLRASSCGFVGKSPLVCCPPGEPSPSATPTTPPSSLLNRSPDLSLVKESTSNASKLYPSYLPLPGECGTFHSYRRFSVELDLGDFPWLTLIKYTKPNNESDFHCGGVLISENFVVTAAHCVKATNLVHKNWTISSVRLGEHDITKDIDCEYDDELCADPVQDIPVTECFVHESYLPESDTQEFDIALLRLERPVKYSNYIRPICLPFAEELRTANLDGVPLTAAGWGISETGRNSVLRKQISLNGMPSHQCNKIYRVQNTPLGMNQLCAGGIDGFDKCRADSGGSLMALSNSNRQNPYWYLAGVIATKPTPCEHTGWPGVSTRAGPYVDWILEHIRTYVKSTIVL